MKANIYIEIDNSGNLTTKLKHFVNSAKPLFNIQDIDFQPKKGDKMYILPGVNIPRVKVKQFNEENGTKTIRDLKTADYIFGSDRTQNEYFDARGNHWIYKMPASDIEQLMVYFTSELGCDPTDVADLRDIIEAHKTVEENLEIYYNYTTMNNLRDVKNRRNLKIHENYDDSNTYHMIDPEFLEEVEMLETLTIYNVNALINAVNCKNVTIDYEMFGQLKNMFESNDIDNHVLAMEIMANSNIIESLLFIEMLFKEHSYQMYGSHTRNHVNFKSLCNTIGKDSYRFVTGIDDVVKSLRTFNVLTADKLDILMKHYHEEIMRNGDSTFFKVKTITVADNVHEILNQNYTYTVKDDYQPIAQDEEEVVVEEVLEEELVEAVNTESLNIESVEEEPSFELSDVNVVEEPVTETVEEVVEEPQDVVETIQEEVIVEPNKEEESGDTEIDWF
jgi:hypothetical protein